MKKWLKKVILPISLLTCTGTVLAASSFTNSTTNLINKNSQSLNVDANTANASSIALGSNLGESFNVNYDESFLRPVLDNNVGTANNVWNIKFLQDRISLINFKQQYISDIEQFKTDLTTAPIANDANGLDLDVFDKDGTRTGLVPVGDSYTKNNANKYGFSKDPYNVADFIFEEKIRPLLKLSYQYAWKDNANKQIAANNPFQLVEGTNTWGFNGYVGVTNFNVIKYYNLQANENGLCYPQISLANDFDTNLINKDITANEFVEGFNSWKKKIKLNITNYLPIAQVENLRLEAKPTEGKVVLKYDLKNPVRLENKWYSDVLTDEQFKLKDQELELLSGFIVNTTNSTVNQFESKNLPAIPNDLSEEDFKREVAFYQKNTDKEKLWLEAPKLDASNIILKPDSKQISSSEPISISYEVAINKKYKNGVLVQQAPTEDEFRRITIIGFKQLQPTTIAKNPTIGPITYKDVTYEWNKIRPEFLKEIIEDLKVNKNPAPNNTTFDQLVQQLITINGDVPEGAKINDIIVTNVNNKEGKITLEFVISRAYVIDFQGNLNLIAKHKFSPIEFDGLNIILPTTAIPEITVNDKYATYLASTLTSADKNQAYNDLVTEIKEKIKTKYLENNQSHDSASQGGHVPEDFDIANIVLLEPIAEGINNQDGTIKVRYKLNKYYDADANKQITESQPFETTIKTFYQVNNEFVSNQTKEILINGVDQVPVRDNTITNDFLKQNNIKINNIFNIANPADVDPIVINSFANNAKNISFGIDDLTLELVQEENNPNYAEGKVKYNIKINKGFDQDFNYVEKEFVQQVMFTGFKQARPTTLTAKNDLALEGDVYPNTLAQLAQVNDEVEFLKYIKTYIINNKDLFIDNLPSLELIQMKYPDVASMEDVIEISLKPDAWNNKTGQTIINFKLLYAFDDKEEIIKNENDNPTLKKEITITGFQTILETTSQPNLEIDVQAQFSEYGLVDEFIQEFETNKDTRVSTLIQKIAEKNTTIPNIKVTNHDNLGTISTTQVDTANNVTVDKAKGEVLINDITITGIYEDKPTDNIAYNPAGTVKFNVKLHNFKTIEPTALKPDQILTLAQDDIYKNVLAQSAIAHQGFLGHIKELVKNNYTNFIDHLTQDQLDSQGLKVEDAFDVIIDQNNFSNNDGSITATIVLKKGFDKNNELVDYGSMPEDQQPKATFTIQGFLPIVDVTKDEYEFNVNNKYFINEITNQKITDTLFAELKQNNTDTIPSIENADPTLAANATLVSVQNITSDEATLSVTAQLTISARYELLQDKKLFVNEQKVINVKFIGFKVVNQPELANTEIDVREWGVNIVPQHILMKVIKDALVFDPAIDFAKLEELLNRETNLILLFGSDYKELVPPDAKLKVLLNKDTISFSNKLGTINVETYFDKVYDFKHDVISQDANAPIKTYPIQLQGLKRLEQPLFNSENGNDKNVEVEEQFGPDKKYVDQVSNDDVIEAINNSVLSDLFNQTISIEKLPSGEFNVLNLSNSRNKIGTITFERPKDKPLIIVKFNITDGAKISGDDIIQIRPDFPTGYNEPFLFTLRFEFKPNGTTMGKNDAFTINDVYVDNFLVNSNSDPYLAESWNVDQLIAKLNQDPNFVDATQLFDGRIVLEDKTNKGLNNFKIKIVPPSKNDDTDTNAATGKIELELELIKGSYFKDNVRFDLPNANEPNPVFNVVLLTSKKRPSVITKNEVAIGIKQLYPDKVIDKSKFAYQLANEFTDIKTKVIETLNNEPWLILNDNNPNTSPALTNNSDLIVNPTGAQAFKNLNENTIEIIPDNKLGIIRIKFTDPNVAFDGTLTYDKNGFAGQYNTNGDLTISSTTINVVQDQANDSLNNNSICEKQTSPLKVNFKKFTLKEKDIDSYTADEWIEHKYGGSITDLIYDVLYEEYKKSIPNDDAAPSNPLFEGLNPFEHQEPLSYDEFTNWVSIANPKVSNNKVEFGISIEKNFFIDDQYYTWADGTNNKGKPLAINGFKIEGFGSRVSGINWPIFIGAGVGVLVILVSLLLVFVWMRHKNKKLKIIKDE